MSSFLGGFMLAAMIAVVTGVVMAPAAVPHIEPTAREWCIDNGVNTTTVTAAGTNTCQMAYEERNK